LDLVVGNRGAQSAHVGDRFDKHPIGVSDPKCAWKADFAVQKGAITLGHPIDWCFKVSNCTSPFSFLPLDAESDHIGAGVPTANGCAFLRTHAKNKIGRKNQVRH
jgi:hypothetical protein